MWLTLTGSHLRPPPLLQFLPTVRCGEFRLLVHFRLPSHGAVPVGGLAVDLLPVRGNDPEVPLMLTLSFEPDWNLASFLLGRTFSSQMEFPPTEPKDCPDNFMLPSHAVTRVKSPPRDVRAMGGGTSLRRPGPPLISPITGNY